ncbi:MAG: PhzF family phenazine biosynthesis protein [Gammaproteobacteria bacterium]|nr:PhzF family phenazine biosynthesis protein [Gammaproteobacteria bacterium]MDH5801705.1 PhzF family phenazine biosynthesis protein [Gammaproteobacteria bacterium]
MKIFQVDAFSSKPFQGNPAAICPLESWLDDSLLQAIAAENNLSETAFFVPGESGFHLRWFTPKAEVTLCGHATLASAHVLFQELAYKKPEIIFHTLSGDLAVKQTSAGLLMDFPALALEPCKVPAALVRALGAEPAEVLLGEDYIAVYASADEILQLRPNFALLAQLDVRGIGVTAPGDDVDFVSRFFAPRHGIEEDPVTGSLHCALTPWWANRLQRQKFTARQLSQRGGYLQCELKGDRVTLLGRAVTYMVGTVLL